MRARVFVCFIAAILYPSFLWAGTATIQWQANPETDLKEYKIYHGTASRSYGTPVPAGTGTSYTFNNLAEGVTHYFSVTAVDTYNNESGFSAEASKYVSVSATSDTEAPRVTISSPSGSGSYNATTSTVSLSGIASDNLGVTQVTWSKSSGGSGSGTASGTSSWSISGVSLSAGQNTITVTAKDAAGNVGTAVIIVSYTPTSAGDTQAPQVFITSPATNGTYVTSKSTVGLAGQAKDDMGVKQVSWSTTSGDGGIAYGTTNWSVRRINLSSGENTITVTAIDAAGNESKTDITVTYVPRSSWSSRWQR
jgi:hypothetical protein